MGKKLSDLIGQFATIPNTFIVQSVALSTEAKWLFVILRYHTNSKTGNAFPSYTKISEITGFHRKTISKSLKELEGAGWLTKQRRFGATTLYALQIPSSSISDTTEPKTSSATSDTVSSITSATISSSDGVHINQIEEETRLKEQEKDRTPRGVKLFRDITGHFPSRDFFVVVESVLVASCDETLARECYREWRERGYNPRSLKWLTEWFVDGAVPSRNGNGSSYTHSSKASRTQDAFAQARKSQ